MIDTFQTKLKVKLITITEGVYLLSNYAQAHNYEETYLKVRTKEKRVLSDELVRKLPDIPRNHSLYKEWQLRKQAAQQFCNTLVRQKKLFQILDLGCGNGWFSAKMALIPGVDVIGLDLNLLELKQARRVFSNEKLTFCYGDIFADLFEDNSFDKVVLNASIQYFPSVKELFAILLQLLKPNGEVHILDSPFYEAQAVIDARERTANYYQLIGYPEMSKHYFHHTFQDLAPFSPDYRHIKVHLKNALLRRPKNPFQWITVKK